MLQVSGSSLRCIVSYPWALCSGWEGILSFGGRSNFLAVIHALNDSMDPSFLQGLAASTPETKDLLAGLPLWDTPPHTHRVGGRQGLSTLHPMSYWPPKTLKSILCSRTLHRRDWYHTWIHGYEDYNHCPFVLEHQTGKPNPTICMSLCLLRVKTLVSKWDLTVPDSLWWEWSVQTACAQSWGPTDCSEQDLGVHRTQAQEGRDPCGETNLRHTGLALLGDWQPREGSLDHKPSTGGPAVPRRPVTCTPGGALCRRLTPDPPLAHWDTCFLHVICYSGKAELVTNTRARQMCGQADVWCFWWSGWVKAGRMVRLPGNTFPQAWASRTSPQKVPTPWQGADSSSCPPDWDTTSPGASCQPSWRSDGPLGERPHPHETQGRLWMEERGAQLGWRRAEAGRMSNCGSESGGRVRGQWIPPAAISCRKSTLNILWKDWCWSSNTLATWCDELIIGKDPDAGKDWRREEKGTTENEMVGWHHRLDGHEFAQALGGTDWHRSLVCCSSWGRKESASTQQPTQRRRAQPLQSTETITHGARVPPGGQIWLDQRHQWPEKPRTRLRDRNHQGHRHSNCNDGNTLATPHVFPAVLNSGLAGFWGDRPLLDIHIFSLKQWQCNLSLFFNSVVLLLSCKSYLYILDTIY